MKTRLLIIIGIIIMITTIPFVTFAALDRYSDYVERRDAIAEKESKAPKHGDKYYIEPGRKAELEAIEFDLREKITQLHQKNSLVSFAVNLDHQTQEIIVMVEKEHFNTEIEKMISEYPENIQIIFFNGGIYLDEFPESEPMPKLVYSHPFGSSEEDYGNLEPIYRDNPNNPGELILDLDAMIKEYDFVKNCIAVGPDDYVPDVEIVNGTHGFNLRNCEWEYVAPSTNSINKWSGAPIYKEEKENEN